MEYESSRSGKQAKKNDTYYETPSNWESVMDLPADDIQFDEEHPELDLRRAVRPVIRFKGKIIERRKHPTDPLLPEMLKLIQSRSPLIQMAPDILGGMPVFKGTLVPVKRLFDYLLSGKTIARFVNDYPLVSRATAASVLQNDATLFYEDISNALEPMPHA